MIWEKDDDDALSSPRISNIVVSQIYLSRPLESTTATVARAPPLLPASPSVPLTTHVHPPNEGASPPKSLRFELLWLHATGARLPGPVATPWPSPRRIDDADADTDTVAFYRHEPPHIPHTTRSKSRPHAVSTITEGTVEEPSAPGAKGREREDRPYSQSFWAPALPRARPQPSMMVRPVPSHGAAPCPVAPSPSACSPACPKNSHDRRPSGI